MNPTDMVVNNLPQCLITIMHVVNLLRAYLLFFMFMTVSGV